MSATTQPKTQSVLARELETYEAHKNDLLASAEGKYVLIKGEDIIETFESEADALKRGYKEFGNAPFLVKQVVAFDALNRTILTRYAGFLACFWLLAGLGACRVQETNASSSYPFVGAWIAQGGDSSSANNPYGPSPTPAVLTLDAGGTGDKTWEQFHDRFTWKADKNVLIINEERRVAWSVSDDGTLLTFEYEHNGPTVWKRATHP